MKPPRPYFVDTSVIVDAISPQRLFETAEATAPAEHSTDSQILNRAQRTRDAISALLVLAQGNRQLYFPSESVHTLRYQQGDPDVVDPERPITTAQHNAYVQSWILFHALLKVGVFKNPRTLYIDSKVGSNAVKDERHVQAARELGAAFMTCDMKGVIRRAKRAGQAIVTPTEFLADYDFPWSRARAVIASLLPPPTPKMKAPELFQTMLAVLDFGT